MSTRQNVINPSQVVINPSTQRPVKVGSRVYNNLVKQNLIDTTNIPPTPPKQSKNFVAQVNSKREGYKLKKRLEVEKPLESNQVYALSNDNKKIVTRNKKSEPLKVENVIKSLSKASLTVNEQLMKNPEFLQKLYTNNIDDNTKNDIQNMILQEMVNRTNKKFNVKQNISDNKVNNTNYDIQRSYSNKKQYVSQQLPTSCDESSSECSSSDSDY